VIIVDSLSTFMIYHKPNEISRFFHCLANKIRDMEGKGLILTISSRDKNSDVFNKIELLADNVVEIE